jgi:hypothetical protein
MSERNPSAEPMKNPEQDQGQIAQIEVAIMTLMLRDGVHKLYEGYSCTHDLPDPYWGELFLRVGEGDAFNPGDPQTLYVIDHSLQLEVDTEDEDTHYTYKVKTVDVVGARGEIDQDTPPPKKEIVRLPPFHPYDRPNPFPSFHEVHEAARSGADLEALAQDFHAGRAPKPPETLLRADELDYLLKMLNSLKS